MKSSLLFDFTVDKENCTVHVKREFAANQDLVWAAWTEPEILDRWWAPQPWKSRTKSMDFTVGGRRLYAMVGPEGEEHWALEDYTSITPKTNFRHLNAFCDDEGNINTEFSRSDWNVDFSEQDGKTLVGIEIRHNTLTDLEKYIAMGFKEGFSMGLNQLDELLTSLKK